MGFWKKIVLFLLSDWEDKVNCMIWEINNDKNKKMCNDKSIKLLFKTYERG